MSVTTRALQIAYGVFMAGLAWQLTLNARMDWVRWQISALQDQLRICKQFPMPDTPGDVYYDGRDLTQSQARVVLEERLARMQSLRRWSMARLFDHE